jgi:hypothetical protein
VPRIKHNEVHGYEVLNGTGIISGTLLGGCLDTFYENLIGSRYPDQKEICEAYNLFPSKEQ